MARSLQSLFDKGAALKARGKLVDAIDIYRQATRQFPESGVAEHNLAGTLGDAGRWHEAETHVSRAFRKGLDAPQTWLVYARALMSLGKVEKAEHAYRETLKRNPAILDAQLELAQLVWMMTDDSQKALAKLDETIASASDVVELHQLKGQVLRFTQSSEATFSFLQSSLLRWPNDPALLGSAIDAAILCGERESALELSEKLVGLQPGGKLPLNFRSLALLATGNAADALPLVEQLLALDPDDQHSIALLATTYRLLGDDRYAQLFNYDEFVKPYELSTPKGWSSLPEYLDDLRSALAERHPYKTHPFRNSLDGGSMIMDFASMENQAIRSLIHALTPAIDTHIRYLGKGDDAVRSRNTGRWKLGGIWSVYLRPNGFHHDHVHPEGWLSSACYITLPDRLETEEKEGWIKFGEPGIITDPPLPWEHAVKPQVGSIVLFPSYMWHGTIPFGGDQRRMTCALDIVPA